MDEVLWGGGNESRSLQIAPLGLDHNAVLSNKLQ